MKKIILPVLLLASATYTPLSAKSIENVKDAYKAILQIFTYNQQGNLLKEGTAFWISEKGEAITSYDLLKGAFQAKIIDAKGKTYKVYRILGANATTDLAKFKVSGIAKNDYFKLTNNSSNTGSELLVCHYTTNKKELMTKTSIVNKEAFDSLAYYTISANNDTAIVNCPLINEQGNLVAIAQRNVKKDAQQACAIDARFINDLSIKALSAFSSDLNALNIPRALPQSQSEAISYLDLLGRVNTIDSLSCTTAYNDFIEQYPTLPEGYVYRATYWANKNQINKSEADFTLAISKSKTCTDSTAMKEDAIRYTLSNLIYRKVVSSGKDSTLSNNWTLSRAEQEANMAYQIQPYTLYLVQKGNCLYASHKYAEAYESFKQACKDTHFASSETFFSAAKALEMAKGDNKEVITLLDSCIARIPNNTSSIYGQYYLERSQRLIKATRYRDAVADYNKYEQLIGPRNLNEQFYDLRSQAEEKAHMYQQAIDDLHTAIALASNPIPYQIDEAALLLNIGEYQKAIEIAQQVAKKLPNNADCNKILGIAYGELKQKTLATKYLNKAKEAGDNTVEAFIEKYSK